MKSLAKLYMRVRALLFEPRAWDRHIIVIMPTGVVVAVWGVQEGGDENIRKRGGGGTSE